MWIRDRAHITVLHSVVVGVVLHAGSEIGIDDVIQTQGISEVAEVSVSPLNTSVG